MPGVNLIKLLSYLCDLLILDFNKGGGNEKIKDSMLLV
jgi:hypothetical protein